MNKKSLKCKFDFNESSDTNIIHIKNRPMYPIIYNGVLYITPICIEQINGFSNSINNKEKLFKNIVERILYSMGGILTEKQYSMMNIDLFKFKVLGISTLFLIANVENQHLFNCIVFIH